MREGFGGDLGDQIALLCGHARYLLVQLLCDLHEPPLVHVAIPLELPQLATQLEEGAHEVLGFVFVDAFGHLRDAAIAAMKELESTGILGVFFVVETVDIFEVAVQGEEEL